MATLWQGSVGKVEAGLGVSCVRSAKVTYTGKVTFGLGFTSVSYRSESGIKQQVLLWILYRFDIGLEAPIQNLTSKTHIEASLRAPTQESRQHAFFLLNSISV